MIQQLNGTWNLYTTDGKIRLNAEVPGSLYSAMLENNMLEDPYYRLNQYDAIQYSETDAVYEHNFIAEGKILDSIRKYLRFDGIDTIADIYLNDVHIGSSENMHRVYEFDVSET
ncbi:MAG: glycoside hydrolase family 2 protein, partial [Oscillospiraceae bacterium]|nr:glycoside hydrolase family 2 protein [Oscillospiraceae bacterium]